MFEQTPIILNKVFVGLAGLFGLCFGSCPEVVTFVYALILIQLFDILTGVISTFMQGNKFDYRFFLKGISKKILVLVAVSFGYFIDSYNILGASLNINFETAFASAFIMVEFISVLGNFKKAGVDLPFVEKYLKLDDKEITTNGK